MSQKKTSKHVRMLLHRRYSCCHRLNKSRLPEIDVSTSSFTEVHGSAIFPQYGYYTKSQHRNVGVWFHGRIMNCLPCHCAQIRHQQLMAINVCQIGVRVHRFKSTASDCNSGCELMRFSALSRSDNC